MKFLHAADIHLDSALHGLQRYEGAPVEAIRGATRRAFDRLIDLAITERVAFVLLAGDLFDGDWKDYNSGLYFVGCMRRLQQAGIRVFIVAGNHDAASQISRNLRLPDNVLQFSTSKPQQVVLDDLDIAIVGQGFATRAVTEDLSAAYPRADPQLFTIGLLHTCMDGKLGHDPYAPCSVDGLRGKGYDYWALGHVHRRTVVSEQPWIVFPGNTQGRHIRETGAKGCTLVTVDNAQVSAVEHRELDVLRWAVCELDIAAEADVDQLTVRVRQALQASLDDAGGRPLALRLQLQGAGDAHAELQARQAYWEQEFRALANGLSSAGSGAGLWLEKVRFRTRARLTAQDAPARDDAIGGLSRTIDALELDDAGLASLADELTPLVNKLPAELANDSEPYRPADSEQLRATLDEVKALLLTRLSQAEPQA